MEGVVCQFPGPDPEKQHSKGGCLPSCDVKLLQRVLGGGCTTLESRTPEGMGGMTCRLPSEDSGVGGWTCKPSDGTPQTILDVLDTPLGSTQLPTLIGPGIPLEPQKITNILASSGNGILTELRSHLPQGSQIISPISLEESLLQRVTDGMQSSLGTVKKIQNWVATQVAAGDVEAAKAQLAKLEQALREYAQAAMSRPESKGNLDARQAVFRAAHWLKACEDNLEALRTSA